MISLNDVLLAASNIPVDDPIAEIWGRGLQGGYRIIEYTGSLPITINANGDALLDYRIYGASGGVEVATENLFDIREVNNPPKCTYSGSIFTITGQGSNYDVLCKTNGMVATPIPERMIAVSPGTYTIILGNGTTAPSNSRFSVRFFDGERVTPSISQDIISPHSRTFTVENNGYLSIVVSSGDIEIAGLMITKGSTAPTNYIPYGYKLPMTVQSANLFDKNAQDVNKGYVLNSVFNNDGSLGYSSLYSISEYMQVEPLKEYFLINFHNPAWQRDYGCACFYDSDKNVLSVIRASDAYSLILTAPELARFIRISVYFQTCIFCSSVPQKENIYIGENQLDSVEGVADYVDKANGKIVRMIGEYTFTGDESFNKYGNSDAFYTSKTIDPVGITTVNTITMRCNHPAFTAIENKDTRYWLNPEADDVCCFLPGGRSQVFFRSTSNFTTAAECEAYLKAQYDNGTPVKISYWLKTPVEENPPVSFPDIPTINGETVIDYDGEPKPSQMYVKYKDKSGGA